MNKIKATMLGQPKDTLKSVFYFWHETTADA